MQPQLPGKLPGSSNARAPQPPRIVERETSGVSVLCVATMKEKPRWRAPGSLVCVGCGGLQLGSGSTRILQIAVVQVSLKGAGHAWSGALESRIVTGAPRKPNCGRCANVTFRKRRLGKWGMWLDHPNEPD